MRLPTLRTFAISLPHATVGKQWGEHLVFKIAGKIFLIVGLDAEIIDGVTLKCLPAESDDLTAIDGIIQAPCCAKRHWVRLADLGAVPAPELQRLIRQSYGLLVAKLPKEIQATLR
jgi:predicted DNA-binding protein (MmcQ/YjbR family)